MTPQEIIAGFQKLKGDFLKKEAKRLNIKIPTYHTKKDHEELLNISTIKAKRILKQLCSGKELESSNCTFCLLNITKTGILLCNKCGYGDRHGECDLRSSDIRKTRKLLCCPLFSGNQFRLIQREYLLKYRGA